MTKPTWRRVRTSLILLTVVMAAVGMVEARESVPAAPSKSTADRGASCDIGKASWYGHPYHGRIAADGSRYDMMEMTAAHRTLPFGTMVEVTRLDTGTKTRVRITDRGPFVRGRIIDLSKAAAMELDMLRAGVVRVKVCW